MHLAKQRNQYASDGQTAIFEMAEIVGLKDVPLNQQQPLRLSTRVGGTDTTIVATRCSTHHHRRWRK